MRLLEGKICTNVSKGKVVLTNNWVEDGVNQSNCSKIPRIIVIGTPMGENPLLYGSYTRKNHKKKVTIYLFFKICTIACLIWLVLVAPIWSNTRMSYNLLNKNVYSEVKSG